MDQEIIVCPTPLAILLPTYNGEKYIKEQLDSIINQSNRHWTLFIRDDGSSDSTLKIITDYSEKDSRIKIIKSKENLGLNNNFYCLLRSIEADFYMYADQDDVWNADKIALSMCNIEKIEREHPGRPIIVGSHYMVCDSTLRHIRPSFWYTHNGYDSFLKYNYAAVNCSMAGADMAFNKATRNLVLASNTNRLYYDHWTLLCALKNDGVIKVTPHILRYYRQHEHNAIGANKKVGLLRKKITLAFTDYKLLKEIEYGGIMKYTANKIASIILLRICRFRHKKLKCNP